MATDKPRTTITMTETMAEEIKEYQHRHKFSNMTQAIIDLIDKGINILEAEAETNKCAEIDALAAMDLNRDEAELIANYRKLNSDGKKSLMKLARMHAQDPDYLKDTSRAVG